jgi:Alginate export
MMPHVAHPTRRSLWQRPAPCALASSLAALAIAAASGEAAAQAPPLPESVTIGSFTFRPSLEVRVRGEYRVHPVDAGGAVYFSHAVLEHHAGSTGRVAMLPSLDSQLLVSERARLGLAVEAGPVSGVFTLQDARAFGDLDRGFISSEGTRLPSFSPFAPPGEPALPSLAPLEAYVDLHTRSGRRMSLRIGRQRVAWGDGRLVGDDDWSTTARSLDAVRASIAIGDVDIQAMGALLSGEGFVVQAGSSGFSSPQTVAAPVFAGLFGLDVTWRFLPLLNLELTGLARLAQAPVPRWLTPGDTYVTDARIFGDYRGFRYAVEGAYEFGHVEVGLHDVPLAAFALAARAGLETALRLHLTFEVEAAYASGDSFALPSGAVPTKLTHFDPILPDSHTALTPMNMFAWSNILTVGGDVRMKFVDELGLMVGYRFANLASASEWWTTAELAPVGVVSASAPVTSPALGHEIDASLKLSPFRGLDFEGGYGLFLFGDGARAILSDAGRPATLAHWAYLQAMFRAP